jgi:hypothetical protein
MTKQLLTEVENDDLRQELKEKKKDPTKMDVKINLDLKNNKAEVEVEEGVSEQSNGGKQLLTEG